MQRRLSQVLNWLGKGPVPFGNELASNPLCSPQFEPRCQGALPGSQNQMSIFQTAAKFGVAEPLPIRES